MERSGSKSRPLLKVAVDGTSGDFPKNWFDSLRLFRRNISITSNHRKIVKTISRALVTQRDENGKPYKKEVLWYSGHFAGTTYKGAEHHADYTIGRFERPKIIPNESLTYNTRTGEPIGPEKRLGHAETIYEIEVPKTKEARKKLIDSILGEDNYADNVLYYVRHLDQNNYEQSRDHSFSYEDFVNCSIEELVDVSQRGSGSKSSPYYTDKDGQLRYKKTDTPVTSKSNKAVYQ